MHVLPIVRFLQIIVVSDHSDLILGQKTDCASDITHIYFYSTHVYAGEFYLYVLYLCCKNLFFEIKMCFIFSQCGL